LVAFYDLHEVQWAYSQFPEPTGVPSSGIIGVLPQDSVLLFGSVVELARSQNHHPQRTRKQKEGTFLKWFSFKSVVWSPFTTCMRCSGSILNFSDPTFPYSCIMNVDDDDDDDDSEFLKTQIT